MEDALTRQTPFGHCVCVDGLTAANCHAEGWNTKPSCGSVVTAIAFILPWFHSAAVLGQSACRELHSQAAFPVQHAQPAPWQPVLLANTADQLCCCPTRHLLQSQKICLLLFSRILSG